MDGLASADPVSLVIEEQTLSLTDDLPCLLRAGSGADTQTWCAAA